MDAAAHYKSLVRLGRQEFLAASAPAVLLRHVLHAWPPSTLVAAPITEMLNGEEITAPVHSTPPPRITDVEVYPLIKKPAAAFPGMITVGRTVNNDVVLANQSISRLHLYMTHRDGHWWVADAGSKNGSWLAGERLAPRRETKIESAALLRVGELQLSFHLASDAYVALGGQ
jgi:Inner membrane component of T3SS, cytoplasmic domain